MLVREYKHRAADTCHSGRALDDLQSRTQRLTRRAECSAHLSVSLLKLYYHTSQVKRISHQTAGFLYCHALALTYLGKLFGIHLALGIVLGVDDGGFLNVGKSPLLCKTAYFTGVSYENNVGYVVSQNSVGGFKGTLLSSFGEHDALFVALGMRYYFL